MLNDSYKDDHDCRDDHAFHGSGSKSPKKKPQYFINSLKQVIDENLYTKRTKKKEK